MIQPTKITLEESLDRQGIIAWYWKQQWADSSSKTGYGKVSAIRIHCGSVEAGLGLALQCYVCRSFICEIWRKQLTFCWAHRLTLSSKYFLLNMQILALYSHLFNKNWTDYIPSLKSPLDESVIVTFSGPLRDCNLNFHSVKKYGGVWTIGKSLLGCFGV